MTVFEILDLRFQFEETARSLKIAKKRKQSDLENLKWFKDKYRKYNTAEYTKCVELAETIVENA